MSDQVVENEHAGQHPSASVREVKADRAPRADRFLERHAHRRLELRPKTPNVTTDARHDQHIKILRSTVPMRQSITRRANRQRIGILALANNMMLMNARQPLKLDVSSMPRALHQLSATHPPLRNQSADRSETARVHPTTKRPDRAPPHRHPTHAPPPPPPGTKAPIAAKRLVYPPPPGAPPAPPPTATQPPPPSPAPPLLSIH